LIVTLTIPASLRYLIALAIADWTSVESTRIVDGGMTLILDGAVKLALTS
jgi:hypothetical protein